MFNFNFDWSASMKAMESLLTQSFQWGANIDSAVESGAITEKQYKKITGEDYESNEEPKNQK